MVIPRPHAPANADNHCRAVAAVQRGQRHHHRASEARVRGQREVALLDLDRAIEAYTEGIQLDPRNLTAYTYRARAYEERGEDNLAEADLAMVRKLESR
jgi:Tfp pilus assembly protein PilF